MIFFRIILFSYNMLFIIINNNIVMMMKIARTRFLFVCLLLFINLFIVFKKEKCTR